MKNISTQHYSAHDTENGVASLMQEVAVNHYGDWSHWNWLGWTVLLVLTGVLFVGVVTAIFVAIDIDRTPYRDSELGCYLSVALFSAAAFLGFTGTLTYFVRHLPGAGQSLLVCLAASGTVVLGQYLVHRSFADLVTGESPSEWIWRGSSIAAIASGVTAFGYDGLNRIASWIPSSVSFVVALIVAGLLTACAHAVGERSTAG